MTRARLALSTIGVLAVLCWLGGCGRGTSSDPPTDPPAATPDANAPGASAASSPDETVEPLDLLADDPVPLPPGRGPVQLGPSPAKAATETPNTPADPVESVLDAMQPLQIMLGKWRGTTRRDFDGFKAVDEPQWVWDFRTDEAQPALVMSSETGPYIRQARLTYLLATGEYQLASVDPEGERRLYRGDFSQPVEDVVGDDDKLQRTYKLTLTQVEPGPRDELWQITFNQQENNRYLLELERKRGGGRFKRVDTVSTQREGTSFALSDTDYGEKTCIISQGLGTIQVSHNGRSFYVCCTGCKAAFDEDPEKWIAKYEAREEK